METEVSSMGEQSGLTATVIIAAYTFDRWEQTNRSIESVRHQTRPPAEVILCIDNNADLSAQATEYWAAHADGYPPVRLPRPPRVGRSDQSASSGPTCPFVPRCSTLSTGSTRSTSTTWTCATAWPPSAARAASSSTRRRSSAITCRTSGPLGATSDGAATTSTGTRCGRCRRLACSALRHDRCAGVSPAHV